MYVRTYGGSRAKSKLSAHTHFVAEEYEDEKLFYIVNITPIKFPLRKPCKAVFPRKYNTISREYDIISEENQLREGWGLSD